MRILDTVSDHGVDKVYLERALVSDISKFMSTEVSWTWILGHRPYRFVGWNEMSLPVSGSGTPIRGDFRHVTYDLMTPTSRFIEIVAEFDEHGIVLIQSAKRMPENLELHRMSDKTQREVLVRNGAFLRAYLPHSDENAIVECYKPGYLFDVVSRMTG